MTDAEISPADLLAEIEELLQTSEYSFATEAKQTGKFSFWDDERIHHRDLDLLVAFAGQKGLATKTQLDGVYQSATKWSANLFRILSANLQAMGVDSWHSGPSTPYLLVLIAAHAMTLRPDDLEAIGWDANQAKAILRAGAEAIAGEVRQCIYCGIHKPKQDFSLEHIFPDAMGGNIAPELFKTRAVCRQCNSTAGLFVDGPVIRSWIGKNAEASAYLDFVNLANPESWAPFHYIGQEHASRFGDNEVCEIWVGACGEHVYHIHQKDDDRYDSYVGGNPINRRSDPGRAYLFLTNRDMQKIGLAIRSFARQFKKASRYAGNFDLLPSKQGDSSDLVATLPSDLTSELTMLQNSAHSGDTWSARVTQQIGFEERFLAKIALGMGYKLMGEAYLDTTYAKGLRQAMWEKDHQARSKLLRGIPLTSTHLQSIKDYLGLPGTYGLLLWAQKDIFLLLMTLPGGAVTSVVISEDPHLWSDHELEQYRDGIIFVIAPQLQSCLGPIAFPDFLAHRLGNIPHPDVEQLESARVGWKA